MSVGTTAFRIGRRIGKHPLASYVFCLAERVLPLQRLGRSARAVAFAHPRPSWQPHILIVPTVPWAQLVSPRRPPAQKIELLEEMLALASTVSAGHDATATWLLAINGGARQDIGQVHGHLATEPWRPGETLHPLDQPSAWQHIFLSLADAAQLPESGYTLIVRLHDRTAWVTQSQHHSV